MQATSVMVLDRSQLDVLKGHTADFTGPVTPQGLDKLS